MDRNLSEARQYLDLKLDALKLQTVDALSVVVSRLLMMMAVLMLGAIVLAAFAFGTVILLGQMIGNWAAAAFIIGGLFLVLLVLLLVFRRKVFLDMFVKLFIGIFYGNE